MEIALTLLKYPFLVSLVRLSAVAIMAGWVVLELSRSEVTTMTCWQPLELLHSRLP